MKKRGLFDWGIFSNNFLIKNHRGLSGIIITLILIGIAIVSVGIGWYTIDIVITSSSKEIGTSSSQLFQSCAQAGYGAPMLSTDTCNGIVKYLGGGKCCSGIHIITVDKNGGEYTNIISALDSIVDNSPENRYLIKIMPGTYTETSVSATRSIDGKSYVDIEGSGPENTIIAIVADWAGNIAVFTPASNSQISNLQILVPAEWWHFMKVNDATNVSVDNVDFQSYYKNYAISVTTGSLTIRNSRIMFENTWDSVQFYAIKVDGAGTVYAYDNYIDLNNRVDNNGFMATNGGTIYSQGNYFDNNIYGGTYDMIVSVGGKIYSYNDTYDVNRVSIDGNPNSLFLDTGEPWIP